MKSEFRKNAVIMTLLAIAALPVTTMAQNISTEKIHGLPCWVIRTSSTQVAITQTGGHMAPVTFARNTADPIEPYYLSPWQDEGHQKFPASVLVPLRGDFFCLPFGGNGDPFRGESHVPHGESATGTWNMEEVQTDAHHTSLILSMDTQVRPGKITKSLHLIEGQDVIYSTHKIEGFAGPAPLGHHATLAMPETEGAIRISHSPVEFGMTNTGVFSDPANREYQQLAIGATFESLSSVPSIFRDSDNVDLTRLPARKGFADLIMLVQKIQPDTPSWVTAVNVEEGWLWFSIKDPKVLRSTVFWLENGGRHGFPWNGRNNCVGIEEVTAFFADGLVPSATSNALNNRGIITALELNEKQPTHIHYIQGATRIPDGFDRVADVRFHDDNHMTFISENGKKTEVQVNWAFALDGRL